MKGVMVLFPSASALPTLSFRCATQLSRYLNAIRRDQDMMQEVSGCRRTAGKAKRMDWLCVTRARFLPQHVHRRDSGQEASKC